MNANDNTNERQPGRDAQGPDLGGQVSRRAQVAREMRCWHAERIALEGLVRVRGGSFTPGLTVCQLDQARRSYSDDVRLWVENGAGLSVEIRRDKKSVERIAARIGISMYSVLVSVVAFDAHLRGLLLAETPLSRVQAEIAMGVRDFDGEFRGVWRELVDEFVNEHGETPGEPAGGASNVDGGAA
jgi:hypothetical protein